MRASCIKLFELINPLDIKLQQGSINAIFELKSNKETCEFNTTIAWSLLGDQSNPVVVVLGGISADRYVAYSELLDKKGWWEDFVGIDKAIDLTKYSVLSFDYLGGNSASKVCCSEALELKISTYDQARALKSVLAHLGIASIKAVIGSSYGGMVSLAFSELYPSLIEKQLIISAAAESHPRSAALRSVQRQIVKLGVELGNTTKGLGLARQLGMITYRSVDEFAERFGSSKGLDGAGGQAQLQQYLSFQGEKFARIFNAKAFITLSESIDSHSINPESINTPTVLISVESDELVFSTQIRQLSAQIKAKTTHHNIRSIFGHDAFLKETKQLTPIIETLLECHYE